jgi:hypothetical protein
MSACTRCKARGKTWKGSDPRCAFPNGRFVSDNWNCATMEELRNLADTGAVYSGDHYAAILPWDGCFIVLGWYKQRGRTDVARLLTMSSKARLLTLAAAERFLGGGDP